MTDNEIIKALELCVTNDYFEQNCKDCSFKKHGAVCMDVMLKYVLDLINRQKAEIERLTDSLNATIAGQEILQRYIAIAKAEAIKEFAERWKSRLITVTYMNFNDTIDNLVEEMVGADNG